MVDDPHKKLAGGWLEISHVFDRMKFPALVLDPIPGSLGSAHLYPLGIIAGKNSL